MRQVPSYLILGAGAPGLSAASGRLARHMACYFSSLGIPYSTWRRGQPAEELDALASAATHILLAVSDEAIEPVARELKTSAVKIHFSGSLVTPHAFGAHPLMTFGPDLYAPEKYRAMTFIVDEDAPDFKDLLPGLANAHLRLSPGKKARYHALCVLGGNFSCMLWQKMLGDFQKDFGIPPEAAALYLRQQTENLLKDYTSALTGPLARGDRKTLARNIAALAGDPFQPVYQSFVKAYEEKNHDERI